MRLIDKTKTALRVNRIEIARPFDNKEDIVEQAVAIIEHMPEIDPVHAAGGCYCRECGRYYHGHCVRNNFGSVSEEGFCSYGRRREGAE